MNSKSHVETGRRGKIGITRGQALIVLVSCTFFFYFLTGFVFASESVQHHDSTKVISVRDGDSLWKIASRYQHEAEMDVQSLIREIRELNQLEGSLIYPGQELYIPVQLQQNL